MKTNYRGFKINFNEKTGNTIIDDNTQFGIHNNLKAIKLTIDQCLVNDFLLKRKEVTIEESIEKMKEAYCALEEAIGGFEPKQSKTILKICIGSLCQKYGMSEQDFEMMMTLY